MKKEQPKQECHMKDETSLYICHHSKQDRIAAWRKKHVLEFTCHYGNAIFTCHYGSKSFLIFIIMTFIMLSDVILRGHFLVLCSYCSPPPPPHTHTFCLAKNIFILKLLWKRRLFTWSTELTLCAFCWNLSLNDFLSVSKVNVSVYCLLLLPIAW